MGKLVRTIAIILIAFTLASLLLYRLRLGRGAGPRREPPLAGATMEAEGRVSEVDGGEGRLVIKNRDRSIVVKFDELTSITDSGKAISPAAITPGSMATVFYTRRNGKNRAHSILLSHTPESGY